MRHHYAIAFALGIVGVVLLGPSALVACGNDAVGVDACRRIEEARCKRAPSCGVPLLDPPHGGAPATDVDACINHYRTACLHGLVRTKDPSTAEINACILRIESGACDATLKPETVAECAWLATELGDASSDVVVASDTSTTTDTSSVEASVADAGSADAPAAD